jgi:predicted RNase H-like nuclease
MVSRRGPDLPYKVVAGVTPWGSNWIVASAKMHAATFAPEPPRVYSSFIEVLDERPSFSVIVVNAPVGIVENSQAGVRTCDREARALLGRRGSAVHNAPTRAQLVGGDQSAGEGLDAVSATLLPRYREVASEMSPYRQRVVYEGHPELSFYQLNGNKPLRRSKKIEAGNLERRALLEQKMPGVDKILDSELKRVPLKHLLDAAALLWTARRVFGHAALRLPSDAEWDSEGLRMELVL